MSFWNRIETEEDIEKLMYWYCNFHDSCIVSISYESGMRVDAERSMHFSNPSGHRMMVLFHSQMVEKKLELLFVGLRQVHFVAWQDRYSCELYDAYLSIEELLPGEPKQQIIWASDSEFDIKKIDPVIAEPAMSYIVANELSWRFL